MSLLRFTEERDLPGLSSLFLHGFGHPLSAEEWSWKYRHFPGEGRSAVAVDGEERVLAHAGLLGLPARYEASPGQAAEARLWQLVDWVGDPRSTGLRPPLVALGRWLLRDLPAPGEAPWNFGFPSARHLGLGERVFGYGPISTFRELAGELAAAAGPLPAGLGLAAGDRWEGDPARVEVLWRACCPFGVRRSEAFLNWRYWARPGRYYRFYRIWAVGGDEGSEGLVVFAFVGREALAAEVWLPPGRGLEGALPAVAADLSASGLLRWRFWPPPRREGGAEAGPGLLDGLGLAPGEEVLLGFRPRPQGTSLPPREARSFYCSMGDYDLT